MQFIKDARLILGHLMVALVLVSGAACGNEEADGPVNRDNSMPEEEAIAHAIAAVKEEHDPDLEYAAFPYNHAEDGVESFYSRTDSRGDGYVLVGLEGDTSPRYMVRVWLEDGSIQTDVGRMK